MDEQTRREFLETIAMLESSGGKNFNHSTMESGIHAGTTAAGTYGIMPNTAVEIANRARHAGQITPEMKAIYDMEPDQIKQYIETNPEIEGQFANQLADRVIDRSGGDLDKAAYMWFMGHNLKPEQLEERNYQDTPYVQKFQQERKRLFPNVQRTIAGEIDEPEF